MVVAAACCNIGDTALGTVGADGTQRWFSGRDAREVDMINTADGSRTRIPAGAGSPGPALVAKAGRYSVGRPGVTR